MHVSTDRSAPIDCVISDAVRALATRASAVFVRHPAIDVDLPETSDIDVLAFTDASDLYPERRWCRFPSEVAARAVDVTWIPSTWLDDPSEFAARGLIAHRVLTSDLVYCDSERTDARCRSVRSVFYERAVLERRLSGFFQMGLLTVREVGITWDFPALALFWLHMAHASCVAAGLDGLGRLCPNVYTRPLDYLPALEAALGRDLRAEFIQNLCLDGDPGQAVEALRRVHAGFLQRFSEPAWPAGMRESTRFEYRYWLSEDELRWRISAAEEMCRRGQTAAAVYYLRFYGYALSRVPIVHARAHDGCDVAYLRPERAVLPELRRQCPEAIDDLSLVLAGTSLATVAWVERALAAVVDLRDRVSEHARRAGVSVPALAPWVPYTALRTL